MKTNRLHGISIVLLVMSVMLVSAKTSFAQKGDAKKEKADTHTIKLADGKFVLQAPASWKRVKPRSRIIAYEFSVDPVEGDKNPGRVTEMGAGGSIEANIDRWIAQFSQSDGGSTKERTRTEKKIVAGQEVHLVDISGTFSEQRGPIAPVTKRHYYRMLAAIIVTEGAGNYFFKFYGPQKTVSEHEEGFKKMISGMQKK